MTLAQVATTAEDQQSAIMTALLTVRVSVLPAATDGTPPDPSTTLTYRVGTVFLGCPELDASTAPPPLAIRGTISGSRSPEYSDTFAFNVRNVGSGLVEWISCLEVSAPDPLKTRITLSVSTTEGAIWSAPLAMTDPDTPAFWTPEALKPGAERTLLLRVLLAEAAEAASTPQTLGLSVEITVHQAEKKPPRRLPHWRWLPRSARA